MNVRTQASMLEARAGRRLDAARLGRRSTAGSVLAAYVVLAVAAPVTAGEGGASPAGEAVYHWPLDVAPELTSTFCEFRDGHFHAGIDLSTYGKEGVPVRAVDDGQAVRVRAGALGYGRAIYLRLRDGRLAVYAHLSEYMEPLAEYVADAQERKASYRVDLYPERGRFPVRRGQIIGRSGSSGAGGPHLHFELREGDIALNPLSHGLVAPDRYPPTLRAIVLTPLDAGSRVRGSTSKVRLPLERRGDQLTARETPSVWGRILVGVDAYDRAGARQSRLGIYEWDLIVDGQLWLRSAFDRFSYYHTHEVFVEFDLEEVLAGRRHVLNLYRPPGIAGDFHGEVAPYSGVLDTRGDGGRLTAGEHTLEIRARDAFGNEARASAAVAVGAPLLLTDARIDRAGERDLEVRVEWGADAAPEQARIERGPLGGPFTLVAELPVGEGVVPLAAAIEPPSVPENVAWRITGLGADGRESNRVVAVWTGGEAGERHGDRRSTEAVQPAGVVDEPLPCRVELDPGARVAILNVTWLRPLRGPARATVAGRALDPPDSPDAFHSRFVLPATGAGSVVVEGVTVTGHAVAWRGELAWRPVPRHGAPVYEDDAGRTRVAFGDRAFFEDAYVWSRVDDEQTSSSVDAALPAGLTRVTPVTRIEPAGLALDSRADVALRLEAGRSMAGICLYRFEDGEHVWEGSTLHEGTGWMSGRVRRLGRFFLARDERPPDLRPLGPAAGARVGSTPLVRARLDDRESGLSEAGIELLIDGRAQPVEWDPDADELRYQPRSPLVAGAHTVTFRATDRAGNTAEETIRIEVSP